MIYPTPMTTHYRRLAASLLLSALFAVHASAQTEATPLSPLDLTAAPAAPADAPPALQSPSNPVFVDMLVVYTPAARAQAGSATAMRAAIAGYVTLANTCYSNSGVGVRMRLVGTAEVSYTESASNMSTDLSWVAGNSTVASLRNTYGADLVCLVRRGAAGGAAGVGYLGNGAANFASSAFCVVADDYADSNITFPHEVGHNFGSNHDRGNAGNPTGGYNFGWRFTGNDAVQYRTVMAYAPGTRIAYFSNPSVNYQGVATGVASGQATAADNALLHETNAAVTAAFRGIGDTLIASDYNIGGLADILAAGLDGRIWYIRMNEDTRVSVTQLADSFTSNWTPFAAGKFKSGQTYEDIVFKSADGRIAFWHMNNDTRTGATVMPETFTAAWSPFGAGDMDGDGNYDLLFKATDGRIAIWYIDGNSARTSAAVLGYTCTGSWSPVGAGDFDGNGQCDLLFKSTDGRLAIWFMNGTTRTSAAVLVPTFTSNWAPVSVGDFDGDGKADILFKSTDHRSAVWYMDGSTRTRAGVGNTALDVR